MVGEILFSGGDGGGRRVGNEVSERGEGEVWIEGRGGYVDEGDEIWYGRDFGSLEGLEKGNFVRCCWWGGGRRGWGRGGRVWVVVE